MGSFCLLQKMIKWPYGTRGTAILNCHQPPQWATLEDGSSHTVLGHVAPTALAWARDITGDESCFYGFMDT